MLATNEKPFLSTRLPFVPLPLDPLQSVPSTRLQTTLDVTRFLLDPFAKYFGSVPIFA
jgi:hypothetical protein